MRTNANKREHPKHSPGHQQLNNLSTDSLLHSLHPVIAVYHKLRLESSEVLRIRDSGLSHNVLNSLDVLEDLLPLCIRSIGVTSNGLDGIITQQADDQRAQSSSNVDDADVAVMHHIGGDCHVHQRPLKLWNVDLPNVVGRRRRRGRG